jgi:hypothetical protein
MATPFGPMSLGFIIATPIVVGALTVYGGLGNDFVHSTLALYFTRRSLTRA